MAEGIFGGVFGATGGGAGPSAPTLAIVVSGNSAIATIDGDAGVTNYLRYKASSDSAWTDGGSRSGDGDITVSGLTSGVLYTFVVYSASDSGNSVPSESHNIRIALAAVSDMDTLLLADSGDMADEFLDAFADSEEISILIGGDTREVRAIVDRFGPGAIPGAPSGTTKIHNITVKNSATDGLSTSEFDSGVDRVMIANRLGGTQYEKKLTRLMLQDVGMATYKVA